MDILPLPKEIFDRAKDLGVTEIYLEFSGGNDEGYLEVDVVGEASPELRRLTRDVRQWAKNAYDYSGAGDGTPYGDNISYHLDRMEVEHQDWCMVEQYSAKKSTKLDISNDE